MSLLSSYLIAVFFFGQEYQNPDRYELAYDLLERTRDSEANLRSGAMVDAGDLYYYGRVNESAHTEPGVVPVMSSGQMALSHYEEAAESKFLFSVLRPFFLVCWFTSVTVAFSAARGFSRIVPTALGLSSISLPFSCLSYYCVDLCVRTFLPAFGFVPEFPGSNQGRPFHLYSRLVLGLISFISYLSSLQDLPVWIFSLLPRVPAVLGSYLCVFHLLSCFRVEFCVS
jgi:hypothetical protein